MKVHEFFLPVLAVLFAGTVAPAQDPAGAKAILAARSTNQEVARQKGSGNGGFEGGADSGRATPIERIKVAKDFKVELLYTVPRARQGSWVSMCVAPGGRLIVSDQGGAGLFEVTPPPPGGAAS